MFKIFDVIMPSRRKIKRRKKFKAFLFTMLKSQKFLKQNRIGWFS